MTRGHETQLWDRAVFLKRQAAYPGRGAGGQVFVFFGGLNRGPAPHGRVRAFRAALVVLVPLNN